MEIIEAISYNDGDGHQIDVPPGFSTDGASIPRALWSIVGSPFSGGNYIEAAVIHDEGCVLHKYSWQITHHMFYTAMLDSGVDPNYAKLLYYGVRIGGPRWETVFVKGGFSNKKEGPHIQQHYETTDLVPTNPVSEDQLRAFQQELSAREAQGEPITEEEIDQTTKNAMYHR